MEESSVYLHINNGGIIVHAGKDDAGYLGLRVIIHHFNHQTNHIQINTSAKGLRKIGEMLIAASEKNYRESEFKADLVESEQTGELRSNCFDSTE